VPATDVIRAEHATVISGPNDSASFVSSPNDSATFVSSPNDSATFNRSDPGANFVFWSAHSSACFDTRSLDGGAKQPVHFNNGSFVRGTFRVEFHCRPNG
jgi:hypothetical protein